MPTTASGLQFEDVKGIGGQSVKPGQVVQLHYRVALSMDDLLLSRNLLDQHENHGGAIEIEIGKGKLLPGIEEGLAGMRIADKRRLTIPPQLAFGKRGIPGRVPENATLFVELYISTKSTPSQAQAKVRQ